MGMTLPFENSASVKSPAWNDLCEGYKEGYILLKNYMDVDHTALDVSEQYLYARDRNFLTKETPATYNNRWLQFTGTFQGKTKRIVDHVRADLGASKAHIYANWVQNGHQYGRHNDGMDVIIVQVWNTIAYCVESPFGGCGHTSFVLSPGDAIYIRAGTWHTPVIFGERMSLSFSW
jgi:ribosomal protein L16 Arg81 hydroxylase